MSPVRNLDICGNRVDSCLWLIKIAAYALIVLYPDLAGLPDSLVSYLIRDQDRKSVV